jgi:hypothetical protein
MFSSKKTVSRAEALGLLNCRRLPARVNTTEASVLLGVNEHDIPTLIAAKLLFPLGKPAPNAPKYFASIDIQTRAEDREWLSQATRALARFWNEKNRKKISARQQSECRSI